MHLYYRVTRPEKTTVKIGLGGGQRNRFVQPHFAAFFIIFKTTKTHDHVFIAGFHWL